MISIYTRSTAILRRDFVLRWLFIFVALWCSVIHISRMIIDNSPIYGLFLSVTSAVWIASSEIDLMLSLLLEAYLVVAIMSKLPYCVSQMVLPSMDQVIYSSKQICLSIGLYVLNCLTSVYEKPLTRKHRMGIGLLRWTGIIKSYAVQNKLTQFRLRDPLS